MAKKLIAIDPNKHTRLQEEIISELKKANHNRAENWEKQVSWHRWGNLSSFLGLMLGVANVVLVACGLYYYPEETRALFNKALELVGVIDG